MKVKVMKERMRYWGDNGDDVLAVYLISDGVVEFLAQYLVAIRADGYNGVIIRVVKFIRNDATALLNVTRCIKKRVVVSERYLGIVNA